MKIKKCFFSKSLLVAVTLAASLTSLTFANQFVCKFNSPCVIPANTTAGLNSPSTEAGTWDIESGTGTCKILSKTGSLSFNSWNYQSNNGLSNGSVLKPNTDGNWNGRMYNSAANNGTFNHFELKLTNKSNTPVTVICKGTFQKHLW